MSRRKRSAWEELEVAAEEADPGHLARVNADLLRQGSRFVAELQRLLSPGPNETVLDAIDRLAVSGARAMALAIDQVELCERECCDCDNRWFYRGRLSAAREFMTKLRELETDK